MNLFESLTAAASARGLKFLLIGGHAVAAHGYGRTTDDVDILVCKEDRPHWILVLESIGYSLQNDGGSFLQFSPPANKSWAVDVMLVNRGSFDGMLRESLPAAIGQTQLNVVSLNHLLALKLFALKQRKESRTLKDLDDVGTLLQQNRVDVRGKSFRNLIEKYGDPELYNKILSVCG